MSIGASRPDQIVVEAQTPVLSVSGLTTSFLREREWSPVVRTVSFDIAPRETVAIVGESGSGKSVTALSIMRLIPKESGRIEGCVTLAGRDLLALPETSMKDIRGNDVATVEQGPRQQEAGFAHLLLLQGVLQLDDGRRAIALLDGLLRVLQHGLGRTELAAAEQQQCGTNGQAGQDLLVLFHRSPRWCLVHHLT